MSRVKSGCSPALQISRQHAPAALKLNSTSTFVQDHGSMAIDALTPKPASSSLDRVSLVPTADSWAGRSGSPVFAERAGSAGFQISAPNRASAHRYVVVCGFLDLTLSSPWMLFSCWKFDEDDGRFARVVCCVRGGHVTNVRAIRRFSTLATPTTVSPAPATKQKQHHKNNQYGFHCFTSLVREAGMAFVTVISYLH
jgi:hypothetical protein